MLGCPGWDTVTPSSCFIFCASSRYRIFCYMLTTIGTAHPAVARLRNWQRSVSTPGAVHQTSGESSVIEQGRQAIPSRLRAARRIALMILRDGFYIARAMSSSPPLAGVVRLGFERCLAAPQLDVATPSIRLMDSGCSQKWHALPSKLSLLR